MSVPDLFQVDTVKVATPVVYKSAIDANPDGSDSTTEVIFAPAKLFRSFFTLYKEDGETRIVVPGRMAEANITDGDPSFSIVVGHRAGSLDIDNPTPVIVHFVSIEGIEQMTLPTATEFVSLISLHSWSYSYLPPSSLNVSEAFAQLGRTLRVLRPSLTKKETTKIRESQNGDRVLYTMQHSTMSE
ncbi:MAG: hypothetical protein M1839_003005 [Geoglossum umbratile]|nr:MAG: hypothetical protein M1839_003005 [Geoglossum umbratile]